MNPAALAYGGHAGRRVALGAAGLVLAAAVVVTAGLGGAALSSLGGAGSATPLSAGASAVVASAGAPDLTVAEIGTLAEGAGFAGSGVVMAIAIALAESGGDPAATDHDSNGTVDRGVWQINSTHTEYSAACDYDPSCAADAAFAISAGGTDWSAWVTYQRGEEIAFLPVAVSFAEGAEVSS